ncbi:MAG: beta-lactamase family protein, partial [Gammaproteobacteria bacterium]|nr:beta-lactamase family protein [Gammaproteobacteria bacterium]
MILSRSLVTLFLLLLVLPAYSGGENYQAWLDEAFPADGPGATVILVRDGDAIFRGAAGMANLELAVPMEPDHVLRIASITKQFTAAAILLLQDRGLLDVADDISQYLPDFPTQGEHITIARLLSHTSGVFSFTDIPGYWHGDLIRTDRSVGEMIELFADQPMRFSPGTDFSYSNSGYTLLGAIIERVSGKTYAEFLRTEVFEPLGMDDTQYGGRHVVERRASGYEGHENQYFNALPISMTHPHAAGALLSTVDDLARWNTALFGGRLLSD